MKGKAIIAYDVGTGGTKAVFTDVKGKVLNSEYRPTALISPRPGWVEQDPERLWKSVTLSTKKLLSNVDMDKYELIGICMSAQMLNILPLDAKGNPLSNMLSWLDTRSISQADCIMNELGEKIFIKEVANLPTAKDIIPKIIWLREERPEIWKRTHKIVDCKEYILFKMTNKIAVDWHGASVYFLFDPRKRKWSYNLCDKLEIPPSMLPDAFPSTTVIGEVTPQAAKEMGVPSGVPVIIGAGDCGMAQVGTGTVKSGKANLMTGTATLISVSSDYFINDEKKPFLGLCHVNPISWIIAGEMETGGGSLMWFRDIIGKDIASIAKKKGVSIYQYLGYIASEIAPGSDNLIFTPWLSGERAPVLNHYLRGAFIGLTFGHTIAHMTRSIMEGVGYHLKWIKTSMEKIGIKINNIHAMGGIGISDVWMQIISDILEQELHVVENSQEAGAVGAAITAAVGLGLYPDLEIADDLIKITKVYRPQNSKSCNAYKSLFKEYLSLYESLAPIYKRIHKQTQSN